MQFCYPIKEVVAVFFVILTDLPLEGLSKKIKFLNNETAKTLKQKKWITYKREFDCIALGVINFPGVINKSNDFLYSQSYSATASNYHALIKSTHDISRPWLLTEETISQKIAKLNCLSSSITETAPGHFCAVWKVLDTTNLDIKKKVGIWIANFDGQGWSAPQEVATVVDSNFWNPVVCKDSKGDLLLFYRMGPKPRDVVSFVKKSIDHGKNWSYEVMLPAGIVGPTKNKPILTPGGELISPSSVEVGEPNSDWKAAACWIEVSADDGNSWQEFGPIEHPYRKLGVIEPTLFLDKDKNIKMPCRD